MPDADAAPAQRPEEQEKFPVAHNAEQLQKNLQTEKSLDEIGEMLQTQEGKEQLLQTLREQHPELEEEVDAIMEQIDLNREQLQKKESFFKRMLKLPGRAANATWETIKNHKTLTVIVLLALAAGGAYYAGYLPKLQLGGWLGRFKDLLGIGGAEAAGESAAEAAAEGAAESAAFSAEGLAETLAEQGAEGAKVVLDGEGLVHFNDQRLTIEEFAKIAGKAQEADPDMWITVGRTAGSRTTNEIALQEHLLKQGLEKTKNINWSDALVPNPAEDPTPWKDILTPPPGSTPPE